jgi:hypothetical protein
VNPVVSRLLCPGTGLKCTEIERDWHTSTSSPHGRICSKALDILVCTLVQAPLNVLRELVDIVERVPLGDLGRDCSGEHGQNGLGEDAPARRADWRCGARARVPINGRADAAQGYKIGELAR